MPLNQKSDYSKKDIKNALIHLGFKKGDNLFCHSNIGFFGKLEGASNPSDYYKSFKEAIFEVITERGTFIVPTFTYSFCWQKTFDKNYTPSVCGFLSEAVRNDREALRSEDANFSVAAIGINAKMFTENAPEYSFGPHSFWEKFLNSDGKFCNFNFDSGSTFVHYLERLLGVKYRYDKAFIGKVITDSQEQEKTFYHFVYDLDKSFYAPDFTKLDKLAKEREIAKTANLGKGQILLISARDKFELIREKLKTDPTFLIKGK